jgi:hypothetical protein
MASAASGASNKLKVRTTASPISRMGTSVGMAGSLAKRQDGHQHGVTGGANSTTPPGKQAQRGNPTA